MKLKLILVIATGFLLAACSVPENTTPQASSLSKGNEYSGLGINNPELSSREPLGGSTAVTGAEGSNQLTGLDLQIKNAYDQYLRNCYNNSRAQAWKNFLNTGGTMENFVATLQIVSTATTCSADGQESITDPHYIRGYYDFYLPGCYNSTRHAAWQEFFDRGGTDNDFRITLQRVSVSSPRPDCLR